MYGLQEALFRERSAECQRRCERSLLGRQVAGSRRWRRRDEQARRSAEQARAVAAARRDYDLAGR